MRWLLSIIGIVLVLFGILWILQGLSIVPVGFMAGHLQYAVLGLLATIAGVLLVLFANRRIRNAPSSGARK